MLHKILRALSRINHARISQRKAKKIQAELRSIKASCSNTFPKKIKRVLIIDPLVCFGDSLFINGLLHCVSSHNIEIGIFTFSKLNQIYSTVIPKERIFNFENPLDISAALSEPWDIAIDLCYIFNQHWNERRALIENISCYTICCDLTIQRYGNHIYSDFLDLSSSHHFGDRMATIAKLILDTEIPRILPYAGKRNSAPPENNYVYINTVGGASFRCLNSHQINTLTKILSKNKVHAILYCPEKVDIDEHHYITQVSPKNFDECIGYIFNSIGVITPDTSVVHVAAAYNKPTLAFYCENDPEHYGLQMQEVWAPLCTKKIIVKPDAKGVHRIPITEITIKQIETSTTSFLKNCLRLA